MFIPTMDLVFYALGSGEYDEMARKQFGPSLRNSRHVQQKFRQLAGAEPLGTPALMDRYQHSEQTVALRQASHGMKCRQLCAAAQHVLTSMLLSLCVAVSNVLRVIMIAIADTVNKPPTESVMFEKYARIASVIDEVINEVGGLHCCSRLTSSVVVENTARGDDDEAVSITSVTAAWPESGPVLGLCNLTVYQPASTPSATRMLHCIITMRQISSITSNDAVVLDAVEGTSSCTDLYLLKCNLVLCSRLTYSMSAQISASLLESFALTAASCLLLCVLLCLLLCVLLLQGMLESVDKAHIRKGAKGKVSSSGKTAAG